MYTPYPYSSNFLSFVYCLLVSAFIILFVISLLWFVVVFLIHSMDVYSPLLFRLSFEL
jgi:hypothetical protein